mgnify:CR=1 FL=1
MKREELTPIEELVVNYANNVLNKDIRLEDIDDIAFDWDSAKFSYKPGENGYIKTMEIELKDLGIKYDEIEKYEKEVYTSAINHVVRLVRNDLVTRKATPLLSDLLKLKKVQEEWLDYFRYQLIAFYRKVAGFHLYIETISIDNSNIYFTDAASGKEYFVPLELLSLPVEEAKEKYADILKNEKQILAEEKKQRLESDIANYKKWLEESEEELIGKSLSESHKDLYDEVTSEFKTELTRLKAFSKYRFQQELANDHLIKANNPNYESYLLNIEEVYYDILRETDPDIDISFEDPSFKDSLYDYVHAL